MSDHHIRTSCRLCGSPALTEVLRLSDTPLANELLSDPDESAQQERFPLFLVQCGACGHVQLPVVVRPERLFPPSYPYQSGTSPVFREHLRGLAYFVASEVRGGKRVLDVACNDGTLVRELWNLGIEAHGIDPCAESNHGMFTRGFFTEEWAKAACATGKTMAAVTMLNAFAHIDDLSDVVRGVATVLAFDALFVFEVGYLPDIIAKRNYSVIYHEHLSYHHLRPLVPFFARHGMSMVDAYRIDTQGGSIRVFVRNAPGLEQSDRLRALLAGESDEFDFAPMLEKVQSDRNKLADCIGYSGYGCPAKLVTILHGGGRTNEPRVVFDDNPLKVGKYVPGTSVPILHSFELEAYGPETLVLFSANFADEIKARHSEFKGKWVVL